MLKTAVIESNPPSNTTVEILCDNSDAVLLLNRATEFYPEALPFVQLPVRQLHRVIGQTASLPLVDELYNNVLLEMERALSRLVARVPPARPVAFGHGKWVWRYVERTAQQAIVQKLREL